MTTNKPGIVAWGSFYKGVMQDFGYNEEATKAAAKLDFHGRTLSTEPLIRLSDYEALQAECEQLRRDAERYRFLRADALSAFEDGLDEPQLVFARECTGDYQDCIDDAVDAAIDAARHNQTDANT